MKCDLCGEREATVHLTEMIDDQSRELHLCEPCAREKAPKGLQGFGLAELLAGLADFGSEMGEETKAKLVCPGCKMTYEDFRKTGRLGCGQCYETFHRYLAPLLRRIHGSAQHVGKEPAAQKVPAGAKPAEKLAKGLSQLKEQLKKAVAEEAFEEAARLRDWIRKLEAKPGSKRGQTPFRKKGV